VAAVVAKGEQQAFRLAEEIAREAEAAEAIFSEVRQAAETAYEATRTRLHEAFKVEAASLRSAHEARAAGLRAEVERQVAALLADTEKAIAAFRANAESAVEAASEEATTTTTLAVEKRQAALQALEAKRRELAAGREKLAALREQQRAADTDRHVRATAEEGKTRAAAHDLRSEELTAGIKALRRYAVELAGTLPIKGLEVRYDDKGRRVITLDKIPLDEVNTGRMRELADEVSLLHAAARAGSRAYLPLLLIDWMEQVDEARRAEHLRSLASRGAQVIACVVATGPLQTLRGDAALGGTAA
jgi:hypothetical protein